MAEDLKQATLEPANDTELDRAAGELISTVHPKLAPAAIRFFWALSRPLTFWGRIKVASEETWWVSGGLEGGGADILMQVNRDLWDKLSGKGRAFLLDFFLVQVRPKTSGQIEMETSEGRRQLYERDEDTLRLPPAVLARHPEGLKEIAELERLWKALAEPAQFALEFDKAVAPQDAPPPGPRRIRKTAAGAKPDAVDVTPPAKPAPIHYYESAKVEGFGPVALRYTTADRQLPTMDGIHFFPDVATSLGVDLSTLEYSVDAEQLASVREALEREREEWAAGGGAAPALDLGNPAALDEAEAVELARAAV